MRAYLFGFEFFTPSIGSYFCTVILGRGLSGKIWYFLTIESGKTTGGPTFRMEVKGGGVAAEGFIAGFC